MAWTGSYAAFWPVMILVGLTASVLNWMAKAPGARQVDVQGKTVLPGLIDAHGHVFGLGQMLTQLDLSQTTSLQGALKAIGDYARVNPGQGWLRGRGWKWRSSSASTVITTETIVVNGGRFLCI